MSGDLLRKDEASALSPLLQALINAVHDGIIVVDKDMRVVFANRIAREIFVFPAMELPRLVDITRDRDIYDCFAHALKGARRIERRVSLHVGSERSLDLHVESIAAQDNPDRITGAVGAFFDTTKLERLEQVRREFFANLSHELRTPLTSILSYVETLLSGAIYDNENNIKFLEIIAKHANRMQNLAQDISDLAAIESGNLTMQPRLITLAAAVEEVVELLKDACAAKQIEIQSSVPPDFQVYADAKGLEQILFNLVQNAVNFNKPGGIVEVGGYAVPGFQVITVRDTGMGIEANHIPRIFERLYRVDKSRSRKEGGTGLGLAIVKHLVEAHGGSINVESTPNQGSKFSVFLSQPQR